MNQTQIEKAYKLAKERYAAVGVDTEAVLKKLQTIPVSINCWQGDDVGGFEQVGGSELSGGIQTTGNYPGKARTISELRSDIEKALSLIPGQHRLNLHASYLDNGGTFVDRNEIDPGYFQSWIDWAKDRLHGIDFNPTFFSHDKAADGFTLSHPDKSIRDFWIEHAIACRRIASEMGKQLGTPTVTNFWVPDAYKDIPADRVAPRERLADSLDEIFAEEIDPSLNLDAVESKLFGIGGESYTVGSHEFYMGYAISRQKLLCLDAGHYHPTEKISEKISSVMMFCPELLLHVSRPVRWDSDHVVCFDDELQQIAKELIRSDNLDKIHIGLDFFDASINRVAAWVIGTRNLLKALLFALLEPIEQLRRAELNMDYTQRLAYFEELKSMPWNAVWDYYCLKQEIPVGLDWFDEVKQYEKEVMSKRV
ncbi:L-rhamnose isomerase [Anaerohalosphaera lusitana]|uniref:L-rhamnose isomerase n=1 Tax=Anaerohalosphaera lusitana TaxID=1936003 RepID=A0A1U9NJV2_9BACT|nr:L-rhamnose isomerase [Anaerohalosphaera lusitana]AQT68087.1 L-rhamnose isomerase [Anaerohalosphaera lusitana]